jgi:predicted RNA-binding Zn ribbon-like protein
MRHDGSFRWLGNHPATDLCNTTPVVDGQPVDLLTGPPELARWLHEAGIETGVALDELAPDAQQTTVDFAHRFRDALRPVLEAGPDPQRLHRLNDVVAATPGVLHVSGRPHHVQLVAGERADQLRLDLATAVLDIFRHDASLVRRCANPSCVLLFLDVSKSGRRRWCDMATCGNRAKATAHYRRHHPTLSSRR